MLVSFGRVEDREDGASNDAYIGSEICFEDSGTATTIVPHRHVFGFEKTLVVSFLDEANDKERPPQIAYFLDFGSFSLPYGSGKVLHVVVFAEGAAVREWWIICLSNYSIYFWYDASSIVCCKMCLMDLQSDED
ncbi:hypothetical protein L2E82_18691 [Cichorium intybus]|uniref:Uncharacterized protein n=1 Tax=Cichorium intybus TaxID=13427 RepID=A0ACB9FAX9_CICIN|nr:hypothetical protein L2E82_18691 [Cichorium intybus]